MDYYGPEFMLPGPMGWNKSDYRFPVVADKLSAFAAAREGFHHGGNSIVFDTETTSNGQVTPAHPLEIHAVEIGPDGRPTGRNFSSGNIRPAAPITVESAAVNGFVENEAQKRMVEQYIRSEGLQPPKSWTVLDSVPTVAPAKASAAFQSWVGEVKPKVVMANNNAFDLKAIENMDPQAGRMLAALPQYDMQAAWKSRAAIDSAFRTQGGDTKQSSMLGTRAMRGANRQQTHRAESDVLEALEITRRAVAHDTLPEMWKGQMRYGAARQYISRFLGLGRGLIKGPPEEVAPFNAALKGRNYAQYGERLSRDAATSSSGRLYRMGNDLLPSVTTFLPSNFRGTSNGWGAATGTMAHEFIDRAVSKGIPVPTLSGGNFNMLGVATRSAKAWLGHLQNEVPDWKLVGSEVPIVVPGKYAGTIDAIYQDEAGKHHYVDYKTNKSLGPEDVDRYTKQLAMYTHPDARILGPDGSLSPLPSVDSAQIAHLTRHKSKYSVAMRDVTARLSAARAVGMADWQHFMSSDYGDLVSRANDGSVDIKQVTPAALNPTPIPVPKTGARRRRAERVMSLSGEVPADLTGVDQRVRRMDPELESKLEPVFDPNAKRRMGESLPEVPMQEDDLFKHPHTDRYPSDPTGNSVSGQREYPLLPGDKVHWLYDDGSGAGFVPQEVQTITKENRRPKYTQGDEWKMGEVKPGPDSKLIRPRLFGDTIRSDKPTLFTMSGGSFRPMVGSDKRLLAQEERDSQMAAAGFPKVAVPMMPLSEVEPATSKAVERMTGEPVELYRDMASRVKGSLMKVEKAVADRPIGTFPHSELEKTNASLEALGLGRNAKGFVSVLDAARQLGTVSAGGLAAILPGRLGAATYDPILQQAAALGFGHYDTGKRQFTAGDEASNFFGHGNFSILGDVASSYRQKATLQGNLKNSPLFDFREVQAPPPRIGADPVSQLLSEHETQIQGHHESMWGKSRDVRLQNGAASLWDMMNLAGPGGVFEKQILEAGPDESRVRSLERAKEAHLENIKKAFNRKEGARLRQRLGLGPIVSMVPLWAAMEQHPALAEGFKSVPLNAIGWDAEAASRMSEGISQQYGEAPPPVAPGGGGGPSGGGPRRPGTPGAPPPDRPDDDGGEEPPEPPRRRPRRRLSDLGRMVARESGLVTKVPSVDKFAPVPNWDYDKNEPAFQFVKPVAGTANLDELRKKDYGMYRKHVDYLRSRVHADEKLRRAYETMIANTGEYVDPYTQLPALGEDTGLSYVRSYGGKRHPGFGGEVIDVDNDQRAQHWLDSGRMSQAEERIATAQAKAGSHSVQGGMAAGPASQLAGFIAAQAEAAGQKAYMHASGHPDDGGMGLSYGTASRLGDKARDAEMAKLAKTYLPEEERHGVRGHIQSMVEAHGSTDVGDFLLRRGLQSASWGLSGALVYGLASHAHKAFEESLYIQRAQVSLANLTPGGGASLLSGVGGLASKYGVRPEEAYHIAFRMQGYFGNGPGASAKDPKSIDATMKATTATLLLAKTATIELSEAMGDLIAVTDSFGGGANTMMKTVDGLVSLQKNWGANIEQTVAALARLADLFHEFNIKEPLAAGIVSAIQQKTGESGIQIASKLERVLPNVNDPTVQANITRLGVHYGLFDRKIFMSDKGVDLNRLFNSVGSAYTKGQLKEGDLTRLALAFGGTRNSREFLAMFTGWAGVKKREADFASAGGDAQSRWNQLQGTAVEQLKMLEAAIHNLAVTFLSTGVLSMLGIFASLLRHVAEAGTTVIGTFNNAFDSLGKLGTVVRGLIGASVAAAGASRFMNSPKLIGERRILGSLYGDRTVQGMPVSRLTMREYSELKRGTASLMPGAFLPGHVGADRAELLASHMAWRETQAARAGLGLPAADLSAGAVAGGRGLKLAGGAAEFGGGFIKGLMLPAVLSFTVATRLMTKAMEFASAKIAASSLGAGGGRFAGALAGMGRFGGKIGGGLTGIAKLAGLGEDATALGGLGVVAGSVAAIGAVVAGGIKISHYNSQMAEKRRQDIADYEDAMRALRAQAAEQATPDEKAFFSPSDLVQKYGLGKKIDIYQQARDAAVKHRGFWGKLGTGIVGTFGGNGAENSLIGTSIPGMNVGDIDNQLKTDRATYKKQLENQYTQAKAAGLQWLAPEDLGFREQDMQNQLQYGGPSYVSKALYSDTDPTKISMLMKKSKPTTTLKMVAQYSDDLNQMQDQINFDLQQGRIDDVKKLRQQYYDTLKNEKDLISASSQARAALRGFLETSGDAQREMVSYYNEELKRNPQWDKNSPQYQQNRLGMLQAQVAAFQGDAQNRNTALQTMSGFMVDLQEQSASLLNQANSSAELAANIANMGMRGSQSYIDAANQAGQAYSQYIETLYQNMVAQNNADFGLKEARTTDPVKLAKLKEANARANLAAVNQRDAMKRAGFEGSTGNPMLDQVLKDLRDVATTNKDVASTNKDTVGQFKSSVGAIGDKMGVGANRFVSGVDKFNRAVDRLLHKGSSRDGSGTSGDQFGAKHPHSWQQLMVGGNDLNELKSGHAPDRLVLKTGQGQGGFQTFVKDGQTYIPGKGELYEYRVPGDNKHFFYVDPKTGKVFSTRKELPSQSKYNGGRGGPKPVDLGDYGWSEYDVPTGAYNSGGGLPKTPGGHWETHYDTDTGRKTTTWVPDPQTKKGRHGGKVSNDYSGGMSSFMAGVRREEQGGRYDWNNKGNPNYHGAYQFGEPEWRAWAKGAGVDPSDHSRAAQDKVARWRMDQLARQFHGNYARVAAAWYAGEGGENRWWTTGYEGGSNPSISSYVNSVLGFAKHAAHSGGGGGSSSGGGGGGSSVGIGEMGLYNPVAHIADKIDAKFGTSIISGYRPADAYGEHNTRTAFDIGIKNLQQGWEVARWAKRHADQIGLQWVIFDKHIWNPDRASEGWRGMPDRGSPTANHMDHVHIKIDPSWVTRHADSGGPQSVDKENAKAQVITARRERRMAEIQQEVALLTLLNGPLSQSGQLKAQLVGLRARVRFERNQGKNGNDTEIFNDLIQIQQLLYQAAQEHINSWKLDMELMGDTSNKAQMLGLDARALERQMHQYLKHGGKRSDAAYKEMHVQRRDALRDKALQQVQYGLTDEDFAFQMHQESWGEHVQHLIKLRDSINRKTRAGKELWQQINLEIQGLIDGLNQTFNIPTNITLPTLYQVRRSIAASNTGGAFGVSAMTNPITDVVGTPTYGITTGGSTGNKKITNDAVTKTSGTQSDKLVNNSTTQVSLLQQIRNLLSGKGIRAGEQNHGGSTKDTEATGRHKTPKISNPDDGIIDWREHEAILIAGERRRRTSPFGPGGQLPHPGPFGPGQRPIGSALTGQNDAGLDLINFAIDWPNTKAKDVNAIHKDQREVRGDRQDVREDEHKLAYAKRHHASKQRIRELTRRLHHDQKELSVDNRDLAAAWAKYHKDDKKAHSLTGWQRHMKNLIVGEDGKYTVPPKSPFPTHTGPGRRAAMDMVSAIQATTGAPVTHINHTYNHESNIVINARGADAREVARLVTRALGSTLHTANRRNGSAPRRY